jgi:phosphoribosyl 1,2-cyclic phosphodiesterase
MALYITSLNSGSNGNCYYIGNDTDAVLIDAGLSCREIEKRMQALGLSMKIVKAIFISHEHTDHIKGLSTLANKYSITIYITPATAKLGPRLIKHLSQSFTAHEAVQVGSLDVIGFPKFHDAEDPHSFIVSYNKITVGIFTDIGISCEQLKKYFNKCHAAFLEANYDEDMLANGRYSYILKNRIRGGKGHLSNKQALEVFINHRPPFMTHLLLSHLSKDNNSPELVQNLFAAHSSGVNVIVASRYEASAVYKIEKKNTLQKVLIKPVQADLFTT